MGKIAVSSFIIVLLVGVFIYFDVTTSPRGSSVYTFTANDGESITCTVTGRNKEQLRQWSFTNKTVQSARECVGRITDSAELATFIRQRWDDCMKEAP